MKERAATAASPPLGATERIPRCMSTQHPDNVAMPFFAQSAPLTAEDEVREAYYAFSHLGCDEQMWDFEGKEVDGHVVEKLLSTYESFFAEHPIGESVHLTPRIPNPRSSRCRRRSSSRSCRVSRGMRTSRVSST